jgi:hypothetical protein
VVTYGRSQAKRRVTAKRRQTPNVLQSLLANHGLIVDQSRSLTRIYADEAPSLLGAYAMAIELTDKATVMLSGRLPIALPAGC